MKNAMLTMISLEMELKLRSVSMLLLHIVPRSMNRSTTTLTLLKESLKLLMLISKDMVMEMGTMSSVRLETKDTPVVLTVKKKEQQCHKHPKENTRKIPKQTCKAIVDTVYIETCEERIHTQCEETHERGHHSTRVASHDSHVIASSSHSGHQTFYGGSH